MTGNDTISRLVTDEIGGHTVSDYGWTALYLGRQKVAEWSWDEDRTQSYLYLFKLDQTAGWVKPIGARFLTATTPQRIAEIVIHWIRAEQWDLPPDARFSHHRKETS